MRRRRLLRSAADSFGGLTGTPSAAAIARIERSHPIDVLVNNAGLMPVGATETFTLEQMQACFEVNMFGLARASRAVLPGMRERKSGLLVHLSSVAGRLVIPFFGLYCASKYAMEAYAESLDYELEPFGVRSVIVEPSGHATDLVDTAPAPADLAALDGYGAASEGRDRLIAMFKDAFAKGETVNDARNVAERIADLVEMENPPQRTQVGEDMGVEAVNAALAPIQGGLIEALKPVYAGA